MKLTDRSVAALVCPPGRKDALVFDEDLTGFAVRVTATGSKTFLLQYKVAGTRRRLSIGEFPATPAARARRAAEVARGQVKSGHDPWAARRLEQCASKQAEATARAQAARNALTFGVLIASWDEKVLSHRRASYRADATKRLRAYFAHLKDVPAAGITRSDVVLAIDRVAAERGNTSARRGLAYARACCGWAVKRDLLADNPFSGAVAPGRENTRERVLSDTEIGAMWTHAASLGLIYGGYIRLLLLTLQRRSEVAGMRWDELNADFTIWTMPGNRTKNGRTHIVHMPEEGQQVLRAIYDIRQDSLVFPGRTKGKPISAFSRASMLLKQAEAKGNGAAAIGSSSWFHDIRRTGVTVLAREGFPPHVCDRLLNHMTGAIQGVAAVYQRYDFAQERVQALQAWSKYVTQCARATESRTRN